MQIGIPKEVKAQEYRVGATPEMVRTLVEAGHEVLVESGAGETIGYTDILFSEAGAKVASGPQEVYDAEMVIKVKEPQPEECALLKRGQLLFCFLHLAPAPELTERLLKSGVVAIAYETVTDPEGRLPLLEPMSEIAGRLSIQAGAQALQLNNGGKGLLLGGVPGVLPGKVLVIGGGVAGAEAARMAFGLGANVTVLDKNLRRLRYLDALFGHKLKTLYSTSLVLDEAVKEADLVIGAVLIHGKKAPRLITKRMLKTMSSGSAIVDISIDQGGCIESSRPTTHDSPTFIVDEIVHYCVTNMPGACARTSTQALTNATMQYALTLAGKGARKALADDPHLCDGLNVCLGKVACEPVAADLGYEYVPPEQLFGSL